MSPTMAILAVVAALAGPAIGEEAPKAPGQPAARIQPAPRPAPVTQEELQARYAAAREEPWFADFGWTEDFEAASRRATEEGKLIVGYFSRSYAP